MPKLFKFHDIANLSVVEQTNNQRANICVKKFALLKKNLRKTTDSPMNNKEGVDCNFFLWQNHSVLVCQQIQ